MLAAFGYFSIVPVPRRDAAPDAGALVALPIVGAFLGAISGAIGFGAATILPAPLGAIVALGTLAFLTGAIHLDGFLDGCDAFFASVSAERRREILKDPRHGTFAVVAFVVVASVAGAALAALPPRSYPALLGFVCAAGRIGGVAGAFVFPGASAGGTGSHFPRSATTVPVSIAVAALTSAAGFAIMPMLAVLVPALVVVGLAIERWICSRIGGLAGDAYGFTIVTLETLALVTVAADFAHRT